MPKIPIVSGDEIIKVFKKLNYEVVRQRGSHVRMLNFIDKSKKPLTIPRHKIIGKGLIRKLLRDASITPDDFCKML